MNAEDAGIGREPEASESRETPLCLRCLRPVDPHAYYCPNCGEATGQLTPYIPFVNIPWQVDIWGQMWRQVWSPRVSIPGRIFRLLMIVWNVPILLVGLIPALWRRPQEQQNPPATHLDDENDSAST
ncbi:MAG: hypothetical protein JW955_09385 [Sedimentisphaerales bacterium]|nr:hypothetical protein [Sedimentisphaerales bacterium]